ncbi:hypothetical protein MRX96_049119 [Rhipicephalus microplus]
MFSSPALFHGERERSARRKEGSARRTEELVGTDHRVRRFTPHTITTNTKKWGIGPGPPVKRRRRGHLGRWPSRSRLTLACRGSPGTAARSRPSSGRTGPSGARPFLARPPPHRRPSPTSPEAGELVKKLLRSSRRFPLTELGGTSTSVFYASARSYELWARFPSLKGGEPARGKGPQDAGALSFPRSQRAHAVFPVRLRPPLCPLPGQPASASPSKSIRPVDYLLSIAAPRRQPTNQQRIVTTAALLFFTQRNVFIPSTTKTRNSTPVRVFKEFTAIRHITRPRFLGHLATDGCATCFAIRATLDGFQAQVCKRRITRHAKKLPCNS